MHVFLFFYVLVLFKFFFRFFVVVSLLPSSVLARYTTYSVVVRMGGRQWSVRKRYSQFDQFRMVCVGVFIVVVCPLSMRLCIKRLVAERTLSSKDYEL